MIVLDPQEAKNLLQERVKLIERVDMDVDYNIEGKLPFLLSTLRLLSGLCSVVVCFVFFFPLCLSLLPWLLSLVGKDQYLIQSTQKTVSKSVIAGN